MRNNDNSVAFYEHINKLVELKWRANDVISLRDGKAWAKRAWNTFY